MRFYFSAKISLTCGLLAALMLRASYWQFNRYEEKQDYIESMKAHLDLPPEDLAPWAENRATDWSKLLYRRVRVRGKFDFAHEVVLRNRRFKGLSGVFVLTPLQLDLGPKASGAASSVLVSRGFIPLAKSGPQERLPYQQPIEASFVGLIKGGMPRRWLAPSDPPSGPGLPWVDQWLRVDLSAIGRQLPYPLLPFYLEVMETADQKGLEEQIVSSEAGREEIFMLPSKAREIPSLNDVPNISYPVPVFDTVIPPGRHFGYIFEWAFMALVTIVVGLLLQLRKPRRFVADSRL